jgi:hypothetical protein
MSISDAIGSMWNAGDTNTYFQPVRFDPWTTLELSILEALCSRDWFVLLCYACRSLADRFEYSQAQIRLLPFNFVKLRVPFFTLSFFLYFLGKWYLPCA